MAMQVEEEHATPPVPVSLSSSPAGLSCLGSAISPYEMQLLESSLMSWLIHSDKGKKIVDSYRQSRKREGGGDEGQEVAEVSQALKPLYLAVFAWIDRLLKERFGDEHKHRREMAEEEGDSGGEGGTTRGVKKHKNNNEGGALVVGISAPQGSGKSSLVDALKVSNPDRIALRGKRMKRQQAM